MACGPSTAHSACAIGRTPPRSPSDEGSCRTRRTFDNIKMSLDAAGIGWGHVIRITRYLTDMRDQDELNEVQRGYLGEHKPASTTLGVSHLVTPLARLEIEIVAAVPRG
ncbi:MAG TPA: RidA family protein [bacterium]|nr:RidA family protein [bacterium]